MNFFQLLKLGYKNYFLGFHFLIKHKLYWFAAFPLILFAGVYWLGLYFEQVEVNIGKDLTHKATHLNTLNGVTWMTIKMLFFDSLYVIFTKFTLYIVVILLSPLLSILSERIENIISGNKYKFSLKQLIHDIKRGIRIASRNLFWEYFFFLIILAVASLIGGVTKTILLLTIPLIISFYFYGFAFLDYVNERRRLNIQQSTYFVSKHRGLAISIGSLYSLFFLSFFYVLRSFGKLPIDQNTQLLWGSILVFTFILAAIAPILAITSATLSMHTVVDLTQNEYAIREETENPLPENEVNQ